MDAVIIPTKFTSTQLASAYQRACMAELEALKPGNVHLFADGHGMCVGDFVKSAESSATAIAVSNISVGERIFNAVQATHNAVGVNTNLGIILLCAPLIHAALQGSPKQSLQQNLSDTLSQLTINDAQLTARAIVLANPAGLGHSSEYDVHEPLNITLLELMCSAQHKDHIARQYANNFPDIFEFGFPRYQQAMTQWRDFNNKGQNQAWATTALYLGFMARYCDTHITRKHGKPLATSVMN